MSNRPSAPRKQIATPPPLPHSLFDDDDEGGEQETHFAAPQRRTPSRGGQASHLLDPSMVILELERVRSELHQARNVAQTATQQRQEAIAARVHAAQLQQQLGNLRDRLQDKESELRQVLDRIAVAREAEHELSSQLEQLGDQLCRYRQVNQDLQTARARLTHRAQKLDRTLRRVTKEAYDRNLQLRSEHAAHTKTKTTLFEERKTLRQAQAALASCCEGRINEDDEDSGRRAPIPRLEGQALTGISPRAPRDSSLRHP